MQITVPDQIRNRLGRTTDYLLSSLGNTGSCYVCRGFIGEDTDATVMLLTGRSRGVITLAHKQCVSSAVLHVDAPPSDSIADLNLCSLPMSAEPWAIIMLWPKMPIMGIQPGNEAVNLVMSAVLAYGFPLITLDGNSMRMEEVSRISASVSFNSQHLLIDNDARTEAYFTGGFLAMREWHDLAAQQGRVFVYQAGMPIAESTQSEDPAAEVSRALMTLARHGNLAGGIVRYRART